MRKYTPFLCTTLALAFVIAVYAVLVPGDLDPTFGNGGKVITDVNVRRNQGGASAIQVNGKIVVAGSITTNGSDADFLVIRYNADGSLDNTFGNGGIVVADYNNSGNNANAVAIQADGKIVVFGQGSSTLLTMRFNPDGTFDSSFGSNGRAVASFGNYVQFGHSVLIQPDGKIVGSGSARDNADLPAMSVVRFNPDGTLDNTFDTDGKAIISFASTDVGYAISINRQTDGKLVVAGGADRPNTFRDFAVARLNTDGSLDLTFGSGGKVVTDVELSDGLADAVLQPDGKIVAVGYSNTGGKMALVRYNTDGTLDNTFGAGGKVKTVLSPPENFGNAVAVQPNGKILASASCGVFPDRNFCLVRYDPDGTIDASFGTNGVVITEISRGSLDNPHDMLLQSDGKIVVSGDTATDAPTSFDFAVVRYVNDSIAAPRRAPFDFDADGKTDIGVFRLGASAEWWIQRSSNSSVVAAQFGAAGDQPAPADYTGDGKSDIAFFRPSTATWYILRSEDFSFYGFPFGTSADVIAPADYDGDGKTDPAVFRSGSWYILRSIDGGVTIAGFGVAGDRPAPADYDGDGKADIGIYRPNGVTGGEWWLLRSSDGVFAASFGSAEDKTVVGDWTGDGKADCAFFRPSNRTWYVLRSEDQSFYGFPFGISTDAPAPGDYDGDGKTDAAVFRSTGAAWYVNLSSGSVMSLNFGSSGDLPIPGSYVR